MQNAAWVIQKPSVGGYSADVLALEERPIAEPAEGELWIRPLLLSLDPSNLMWLKLLPGWMQEVRVGDIMLGPAVGEVERSRHPDFQPGDLITAPLEWRALTLMPASAVTPLSPRPGMALEAHLSVFSHVGRAALIGMRIVGRVRPGDTVLVSGAAGATGALACQIAKAGGAEVIGIAGGAQKCRYLTEELGLRTAIDYRAENLDEALTRLCPQGVDMFFDNVGGMTLDAVLMHLNVGARIVICGAISEYSNETPVDGHRHAHLFQLLMKRARIEGFVVPDFVERYAELDATLAELVASGALVPRMHVLDGLSQAAKGLELLLSGGNHGKLVVRVQERGGIAPAPL
jgi:NADPH-dependent curcumin reductase CurA